MPAVARQVLDEPCQLWLDVARPIQPRPRHGLKREARQARDDGPAPIAGQMELRMVAPPPAPVESVPAIRARAKADYARPAAPVHDLRPCFAAWLLGQTRQPGTLGELAKAARLDPRFPKTGSADDIRARFSAAGADGDAFEALDDAERTFDRL